MDSAARIYVAGHRGLVGSAIWRELGRQGFAHLIGRSRAELDLLDGAVVKDFFERHKPEYVFVAAARVGGILANESFPADFIFENLQIQNNILHQAHLAGVRKLLFLGSSCIYPKLAPQPIREESLLAGPLEPTNEWYAVAKIAGLKLCQALRRQHGCDFICAMPTSLYGSNDNYEPQSSHVLPAFIRRFHEAKMAGARRHLLGHRGGAAGVSARRRLGGGVCVSDEALQRGADHQRRRGGGPGDQVVGGVGAAHRWFQGRNPLGHLQARRHAAQVDGQFAPDGPGLATED